MLETRTRKKNQPRRRKKEPEMKAAPPAASHLLNNVDLRACGGFLDAFRPVLLCLSRVLVPGCTADRRSD